MACVCGTQGVWFFEVGHHFAVSHQQLDVILEHEWVLLVISVRPSVRPSVRVVADHACSRSCVMHAGQRGELADGERYTY